MRQKYYFFRKYQVFMTNYVRLASEDHRRIRRFLVATLMSGATGSARFTQREERRRSNYSAREGGANFSPQKLFCQIGRRRRPNSEADFSASVPASQKNHERSEYLDLNWPKGKVGRGPSLSALSCCVRPALFILVYIILIIAKSRGEAVEVSR